MALAGVDPRVHRPRFCGPRGRAVEEAAFLSELRPGLSVGIKYLYAGEDLFHERVLLGPSFEVGAASRSHWRIETPDQDIYVEQLASDNLEVEEFALCSVLGVGRPTLRVLFATSICRHRYEHEIQTQRTKALAGDAQDDHDGDGDDQGLDGGRGRGKGRGRFRGRGRGQHGATPGPGK